MYKIENGILTKNKRKLFAIGESYYPSFHPCKFPVPPDGDRIGEMKKDLAMMAEAGFNHVRFAALGEVVYDSTAQRVSPNTAFVDSMIEEAEKNGLSVSVRLQGFSVNLRGFSDADIIDENGNTPEFAWSDFVRTAPNHKGVLEDNFVYARDLAKHFSSFPSVVGYQTYNEPKFPQPTTIICDYNPHAVAAFRKWLVEKGELTEEEAQAYEPPRSRGEQSPHMWALWRIFSTESMRNFLKNASDGATEGAALPTFTCLTADTACKSNPIRGVHAFGNAKDMDIVGYTIYKHGWGAEYYPMCLDGDTFQCAAESEGKEAWCIELDSRTYIPSSVYNKGTYATIGSGVKGIVYYQWRGDCPVEGVPHPNSCGILNYDGTKTANFENAIAVNRWIASINDLLVNAKRAREGIGLFYSMYSIAYHDALENSNGAHQETLFNASILNYNQLYTDIRRAGYTVTITDGNHLAHQFEELKVLIVPDFVHITAEERDVIERFFENGGTVYTNGPIGAQTIAYPRLIQYDKIERTHEEKVFLPRYTPYDLPNLTGIAPIAVSLDPNVGVQVLEGKGYTLLVITNISPVKEKTDVTIRVSIPFKSAEFTAIDGEREVSVNKNTITVNNVTDGGIVILR